MGEFGASSMEVCKRDSTDDRRIIAVVYY